jgi:hypothetical protein
MNLNDLALGVIILLLDVLVGFVIINRDLIFKKH